MKFAKAHGLGNDFILIAQDELPQDWASWARFVCDRNRGVGGDGVLAYVVDAHRNTVKMRLLNPDGTDGDISGNGVRCLAAYVYSLGLLPAELIVHPPPGERPAKVTGETETRFFVHTNLGTPSLRPSDVPAEGFDGDVIVSEKIDVQGEEVRVTCCSMGNPHTAVFVSDADPEAEGHMRRLGPLIERHSRFPKRTNVEFVTVISRSRVRVKFWERGVGPTLASGTGSASALVASVLTGQTDSEVTVECPGGELWERWDGPGKPLLQSGPVEIVFEGNLL